MNLAELAEHAYSRLGERISLVFEDERITNTQMMDRSGRLQTAYDNLGVKHGSRVALCLVNHPLTYSVFGALFGMGAVAVPVMCQLTPAELRYILADTQSEGIITDTTVLFKVREAINGLDHIKWIAIRGGNDNPQASPPEFALETLLECDPSQTRSRIAEDDPAIIMYTSGTTGMPKGAVLTQDNLVAGAEASSKAFNQHLWEEPRRTISAMPMAHIAGVAIMNSGYFLPERLADSYTVQMQWFQPEAFMKRLVEHQCQNMFAVPTMLSLMINHPNVDQYDCSCLKEVFCGAAPLPDELARRFMDRWGCRIRELYGMTENAAICTHNPMSLPFRSGSAGRPYEGVEVRIVDEEDRPVPPGQRGEIVSRGRTTMKGYYNRPKATAEALRGGWLHSGDIGYLDEEGWLYIVDRKKDMIIRGGEKIYPAELEEVISAHPAVAEVAIVGVPDPVYGENVVAFVVPRVKGSLTETDILGQMAARISKFKLPSQVHISDSLPKSGVGKVLRRVLRESIPC
jgi:long-chain acyl-CoA synthetase